jgi:hypothetical protein
MEGIEPNELFMYFKFYLKQTCCMLKEVQLVGVKYNILSRIAFCVSLIRC